MPKCMMDGILANLFIKMDHFYSKSSSLSFMQIFHLQNGFDLVDLITNTYSNRKNLPHSQRRATQSCS